jgi:hypothetical protein
MSHLSILPTVLRDVDCLARSLRDLGYAPERATMVRGFGGDAVPVLLKVRLNADLEIGWQAQPDGRLALVADLQRLSRSQPPQRLLSRLTRAYAAHAALRQAGSDPALATAEVVLTA